MGREAPPLDVPPAVLYWQSQDELFERGIMKKDYFDLTGKVALVVGASSGLGRQFAKALANQGASVAVAARRVEKLEETKAQVEEFGVKCIAIPCDVSNEESVKNCIQTVIDTFGRIDVLCNNAGIIDNQCLLESTTDQWNRTLATNVSGAYLASREAAKYMVEQGSGRIINTASIAAHGGGVGAVAYHASKAAIANLTRAMACELSAKGVTVNAIAPGVFETEITTEFFNSPLAEEHKATLPIGRFGREGELDGILIYLASDASSFCTGQVIFVDGGQTCKM